MGRRVVVTGLGTISSVGMNLKDTFKAVCKGVSGVKMMKKHEFYDFKCNLGAPLIEEAYSDDF